MPYTAWLLEGRSIAGMMPMGDSFPPEVPSYWAVYFAVEDTDAAVAKVDRAGRRRARSCRWTSRSAGSRCLADPHGAMFSVITLAARQCPVIS